LEQRSADTTQAQSQVLVDSVRQDSHFIFQAPYTCKVMQCTENLWGRSSRRNVKY